MSLELFFDVLQQPGVMSQLCATIGVGGTAVYQSLMFRERKQCRATLAKISQLPAIEAYCSLLGISQVIGYKEIKDPAQAIVYSLEPVIADEAIDALSHTIIGPYSSFADLSPTHATTFSRGNLFPEEFTLETFFPPILYGRDKGIIPIGVTSILETLSEDPVEAYTQLRRIRFEVPVSELREIHDEIVLALQPQIKKELNRSLRTLRVAPRHTLADFSETVKKTYGVETMVPFDYLPMYA